MATARRIAASRLGALGLSATAERPSVDVLVAAILDASHQTFAPVDLSAVCALWDGLNTTVEDLDGPGYLIDLGLGGGEILLRRADPAPRRRFTWAHEIGHWILAENCWDSPTSDELAREDPEPMRGIERWCDRFAGALLMPSPWIQLSETTPGEAVLRTSLQAARRFQVSQTAALTRVGELVGRPFLTISLRDSVPVLGELSGSPVPLQVARWIRDRGLPDAPESVDEQALAGGVLHRVRRRGLQTGYAIWTPEPR